MNMILLALGLFIFFGIHLLPTYPALRAKLLKILGESRYRVMFALIAVIGLALIVKGFGRSENIMIWEPPAVFSHIAIVVMLPVFVLLAAAYIPSNIKRFTRHPMLWGVILWGLAHLLSNGDLGAFLLFGSFIAYSIFDMWSANRRGAEKSTRVQPVLHDAGVAAVGMSIYIFSYFLHPAVIGVPIISW